jgi:predicted regulator of Ras-like GTPase activity (Roadblock/LC7/MglB family)
MFMLKRMEQIVLGLMEFGIVLMKKCRLVLSKLSIERCRVLYTKVGQLIKAAITLAQIKLGLIGLQLQITAHKIHQRVLSLLKRGN